MTAELSEALASFTFDARNPQDAIGAGAFAIDCEGRECSRDPSLPGARSLARGLCTKGSRPLRATVAMVNSSNATGARKH